MSPKLHERYEGVRLLRVTQAFRTLSARALPGRRPCVLIAANAARDLPLARRALEKTAWAHGLIEHPRVPRTVGLHDFGGRPVLELDCDVIGDALEFFRRMSTSPRRMPYTVADAFILGLREAMQAAHRIENPETGLPLALGRLSGANVLFGPDGHTHLIGFGHDVPLEDEHGRPDPQVPHHQAPELALGGAATPSGDYLALHLFMRAGIPFVDKTDALARILKAIATRSDVLLRELLVWIERSVVGALPHERASVDEAVAVAYRIRDVLGVVPDPEGFAAFAAGIFADPGLAPNADALGDGDLLTLGPDAEWVRWNDNDAQKLRGAMRRVILALAEKQQLGIPDPVRSVDLVDIGWPDEQIDHEAALNRVYVTLNRLRKALPDGVVERFDDGYRLRPDLTVLRA